SSAGGIEFEEEYLARVAGLTPGALREAAERHLLAEQPSLCALLPESAEGIDERALLDVLQEATEEARNQILRRPSGSPPGRRPPVRFGEPRTGPLRREELPGGGVLLVKEERAVPLVAVRAVWSGGLRAETEDTAGIAFLLFAETLYHRHPYRLDTLGTAASVARLSPESLADYRARLYPPAQMTLSVVGDVDPDRVSQLVRSRLSRFPRTAAPRL